MPTPQDDRDDELGQRTGLDHGEQRADNLQAREDDQ